MKKTDILLKNLSEDLLSLCESVEKLELKVLEELQKQWQKYTATENWSVESAYEFQIYLTLRAFVLSCGLTTYEKIEKIEQEEKLINLLNSKENGSR